MRFSRMVNVVSAHAAGEPNDVITGGVLDVPGATMFDKMVHLRDHADALRQFLLNDPRGKVTLCMNLILPSNDPKADFGYVIMESDFYVPMSGTNTICTVTVALETGMVAMAEPVTRLTLEAPAGLIEVSAVCENGKCRSVSFDNVPAFVMARERTIDVPGLGALTVDVAYGGMIYVIVDAASVGFSVVADEAAAMVELGERIKAAAAEQIPAVHPENPQIHTVNQTLFAGPLEKTATGCRSKNSVIVSPGRLDRSPCGTGTSARLALLHARGDIAPGETFIHESVIGTEFTGTITGTTTVGGLPAVRPTITGSAWITGFHQHVLDPSDPFPRGYRLNDTWPGSTFTPVQSA
ncbi:proline racemase family protein [Acuticoccus kandeliae]|uniref:proline racemase family protein n=1 Tax=Acuticoccus kandeliae TaxID=2073160 RepID=UPI000D3E9EB7|nr:proline racemase family protein [Acuticoccus kandeliae]